MKCVVLPLLFLIHATNLYAQTPKNLGKDVYVTAADGLKIHCLDKGAGPTILFVPGWTMPADIWENQIAHFSKTHRVVAMDPRSQGGSSITSEGLNPATRARDIKALVDTLKLKPVVLVGWSMGVTELVSYVDQFGTDGVTALVLVDGFCGYDKGMEAIMKNFIAPFEKDREKAAADFVKGMYKKPQTQEYLDRITAASLKTPTEAAMKLLHGMFDTDNRPALAKFDKPTLMIYAGGGFKMVNIVDIQRRVKGVKLEMFPTAGHAVFVDEAEKFNTVLEDFLKEK